VEGVAVDPGDTSPESFQREYEIDENGDTEKSN
jgi:hypothetical protein